MRYQNKPTGKPNNPIHPAATTGARPDPMTPHDFASCPGCDHVMGITELSTALMEPVSTLYKKSTFGYPTFPRRLGGRRAIAVRCRSAKAYLVEVER